MKGHKLEHSDALNFIFAGRSLFTVMNSKTGNRFTFSVIAAKKSKSSSASQKVHFVRVLTNPDTYTFIGTCFDTVYRHNKNSKISVEAQSVQVFQYIVRNLITGSLQEFIEVWHEGSCGKCGRVLTVPDSIKIGIGPECLKSIGDKRIKRQIKVSQLLD